MSTGLQFPARNIYTSVDMTCESSVDMTCERELSAKRSRFTPRAKIEYTYAHVEMTILCVVAIWS